VESVHVRSQSNGPTFSLLPGKSYQLVIRSNQGNTESGLFTVTDHGIEPDESHPPPVYPNFIKV